MSRDTSTYVYDLNLKQIYLDSNVQHPAARRSEAVQITTLIVCQERLSECVGRT